MIQALVIGCGSIGAAYDLHINEVQTHAKALALQPNVQLTVSDIDLEKAREVASKYSADILEDPSQYTEWDRFDIVSLCVATPYHLEYLTKFAQFSKPFIVCEKPVVNSLAEIKQVKELSFLPSRIMVNYIRRFQPGYMVLKDQLAHLLHNEHEVIRHISIRYQRGFLNNCSHALDLISYLFDLEVKIANVQVQDWTFDAFPADPTATLQFLFGDVPVTAIGFIAPSFTIFEIDIYSTTRKISISESGNVVKHYKSGAASNRLIEHVDLAQADVLKNYMVPVIETALACMRGEKATNFESALLINEAILNTISQFKDPYA